MALTLLVIIKLQMPVRSLTVCSLTLELGPLRWLEYSSAERGFCFSFAGAGSIVAIMIGNLKGMEILRRIESGLKVTMVIEVGKKHGPWMNHYSIFFVSVSFFIVTAATVGYFIFYSARRFRITRAQSRKQVSWCCLCHLLPPESPCWGSWSWNSVWAPRWQIPFQRKESVS